MTGNEVLEVVKSGAALAAEVRGVDLSEPLDAARLEAIQSAWHENLVLLFRGQTLSDDHLIDFANAMGGSFEAGSRAYFEKAGNVEDYDRDARHKAITVITNLGKDGKPVLNTESTGSRPLHWHSDNSYTETPPRGSILHGIQVPVDGGGETLFANQYLAYETLSDAMKARIARLSVRQDSTRNTAGLVRPTMKAPTCREEVAGPVHPMVRVHPDTGRPALYLGRRSPKPSSYVVELDDAESDALLDELWAHATRDELVWTHQWLPGDVLMWDNRCVIHSRTAIDPAQPRLMHRALIRGEPVIRAEAA